MAILTDTRINIFDRHTTLYHLRDTEAPTKSLPLGDASQYEQLYPQLDGKTKEYSQVAGQAGVILDKLHPAYNKAKFWRRYLQTRPDPSLAWKEMLPLKASLSRRLEILPPVNFSGKIKPIPRVYLYAFGWSTSLDIRVSGDHTAEELQTLVKHLFDQDAFRLTQPDQGPMSLRDLLDLIADGVRMDAFGGAAARDNESSELGLVVTAIDKHSGNLGLGALTDDEKQQLKFLVRPEGAPSRQTFDDMVFHFQAKGDPEYNENYMVIDDYGRFTWMTRLLDSEETRAHKWLECYHHNSAFTFMHGGQLTAMLAQSRKEKKPTHRLQELSDVALDRLKYPPFTNASLHAFLVLESTRKIIDPPIKP